MTANERKNKIDEHFKTVTVKQFEENLKKSGIETIKPSGGKMLTK